MVQGPDSISFLGGNGDGRFTIVQTVLADIPGSFAPGDENPVGLATGHLNDDLIVDVVAVSPGTNELLIFSGVGDGTFDAPERLSSGGSDPRVVVVGNVVGDARPDVVVGHADGTVAFFEYDAGQFHIADGLAIAGMGTVTDLVISDIDNDGDLDIAVSGGDRVSLLVNDDDIQTDSPLKNGDFSAGLAGWRTEVVGHGSLTAGVVTAQGGFVQLHENHSFLVSVQQEFAWAPPSQTISFDVVSLQLDIPTDGVIDSDQRFAVPDAFEVSLLATEMTSVVPVHRPESTAFFSVSGDGSISTAAGVTFDGTKVTVDVSNVAVTGDVALYFDLIGSPPGNHSTVAVDNVRVNPESVYQDVFTVVPLAGPFARSSGIDAGDIDGDGNVDIVVADTDANRVVVFNGPWGGRIYSKRDRRPGTWPGTDGRFHRSAHGGCH